MHQHTEHAVLAVWAPGRPVSRCVLCWAATVTTRVLIIGREALFNVRRTPVTTVCGIQDEIKELHKREAALQVSHVGRQPGGRLCLCLIPTESILSSSASE